MNDTEIDARLETFSKEAHKECAICRGRENRDCATDCKYFFATATEGEIEAAARGDEKYSRKRRNWTGAFWVET